MRETENNSITSILQSFDAALGPMAGVSDMAFRRICSEYGAEMMYTEMVSAKGLYYNNANTERLLELNELEFSTGAQLFGSDAEIMALAAERISGKGYAFIDINLGCPTPKITKNGDGCALAMDAAKLEKVVRAVVKASAIPVTAKIRLGAGGVLNYKENALLLESCGVSAIAVHARTKEQLYSGEADWDKIAEVASCVSIPVIGNGDINSVESYWKAKRHSGCSGVMIARGALGNPFLFKSIRESISGRVWEVSFEEKMQTAKRHFFYMCDSLGEAEACKAFRKHLAYYTKNVPFSASARRLIQSAATAKETVQVIDGITAH
ncbi:MAG: tRNA dihydrouridine synthase DusB [Eubacteriaceae bacterium]|nr:tRNA dihydrouridine synthase DusB [Eubacteriaceae bacterium]